MIYKRFRTWAQKTVDISGHPAFTWRHGFACRISEKYRAEISAAYKAWIAGFVLGRSERLSVGKERGGGVY